LGLANAQPISEKATTLTTCATKVTQLPHKGHTSASQRSHNCLTKVTQLPHKGHTTVRGAKPFTGAQCTLLCVHRLWLSLPTEFGLPQPLPSCINTGTWQPRVGAECRHRSPRPPTSHPGPRYTHLHTQLHTNMLRL
jgi:hypothetical protein